MNYVAIQIDGLYLEKNSNEQIETQLKKTNGLGVVLFDFPACRNHYDIAVYYLEAAFIGQLLHGVDNNVRYTESSDGCGGAIYSFSFCINFYEKLEEAIEILRQILSEENLEPVGELEEFIDSLGKQNVAFPDLIDW